MDWLRKCLRFTWVSIACIFLIWLVSLPVLKLAPEMIEEIRWVIISVWMSLAIKWSGRAGKYLPRQGRRKK